MKAYILLQILRFRLLSYRITKAVPSMEFVIAWVRNKVRQVFIHYIWDKLKQGLSIRSLIMSVGKGFVETTDITPIMVSLWMLYAMHLNDNSLFCVFTSLDVTCSPNSRFITETMVSSLYR
jgi:hypothetical protein